MTHPLDAYFEANPGQKRSTLCKRAKISQMHLSRLMRGEGEFTTRTLRQISEATGGAVSVTALVMAFESAAAAKRNLRNREPTAA